MTRFALFMLFFVSLLTALPVIAQNNPKMQQALDSVEKLKKLPLEKPDKPGAESVQQELQDPMLPEPSTTTFFDKNTLLAYHKSLRAYYDYRRSGLEHRSRVFKWQLFSAKVIFVIVLVLVGAGIYFAAMQFHLGMRGQDGQNMQTELSASPEGIKVSSPVLGVIILVISLAFFYLYLVYVYPIEDIF